MPLLAQPVANAVLEQCALATLLIVDALEEAEEAGGVLS